MKTSWRLRERRRSSVLWDLIFEKYLELHSISGVSKYLAGQGIQIQEGEKLFFGGNQTNPCTILSIARRIRMLSVTLPHIIQTSLLRQGTARANMGFFPIISGIIKRNMRHANLWINGSSR